MTRDMNTSAATAWVTLASFIHSAISSMSRSFIDKQGSLAAA
jgi:hypothetical protein